MFKAKIDFPVYINHKLLEIKKGDIVPCDEELGKALVESGRCELAKKKPVQEVKIEAPVEKKIEAPVAKKAPSKRGRKKASDK